MTDSRVSPKMPSMLTNVKLEDGLIGEAVKAGGHKTKQAAVNAAMAEYVARRNRLRILELAGKVEFDPAWDYKKMRRGRS